MGHCDGRGTPVGSLVLSARSNRSKFGPSGSGSSGRALRDRALFDLAIDRKLSGCDVVKIRIGDLISGGRVRTRATIVQQSTGRPVQFELLETAQTSVPAWLEDRGGTVATTLSPVAPAPNRPNAVTPCSSS